MSITLINLKNNIFLDYLIDNHYFDHHYFDYLNFYRTFYKNKDFLGELILLKIYKWD